MNLKRVVLDDELSYLEDELKKNGIYPVPMNSNASVSAVIISGRDENMMNMQDTTTEVPVIDVRGMNDEQIIREVLQRIERVE